MDNLFQERYSFFLLFRLFIKSLLDKYIKLAMIIIVVFQLLSTCIILNFGLNNNIYCNVIDYFFQSVILSILSAVFYWRITFNINITQNKINLSRIVLYSVLFSLFSIVFRNLNIVGNNADQINNFLRFVDALLGCAFIIFVATVGVTNSDPFDSFKQSLKVISKNIGRFIILFLFYYFLLMMLSLIIASVFGIIVNNNSTVDKISLQNIGFIMGRIVFPLFNILIPLFIIKHRYYQDPEKIKPMKI